MITIYKNRIVYTTHRNKKMNLPVLSLLHYVGDTVQLDKGVTFGTIMELLNVNRKLVNIIYSHTLGGYDFKLFYDDFRKPLSKKGANDYKTEFLQVYYSPDLFKYEKDERFELNHSWDIHLIKSEKNDEIPYGISFAKLSEFKKHPIRIKNDVDIFAYDSTKKHTKKSLSTPIVKATLGSIKLYDFIWAILYEISWMGSPSDRDQSAKKIEDQVHDIEAGTAKLIPWDEAMKETKKKIALLSKKKKK